MPKRRYTPEDIATALALLEANDGNVFKTAKELGMPMSTLRLWREGKGVTPKILADTEDKKVDLADLFERVVRINLEHAIKTTTVRDMSGRDAVMAAAIATDKMRLLRNQPTNINRNERTVEDSRKRLQELIEEARKRSTPITEFAEPKPN